MSLALWTVGLWCKVFNLKTLTEKPSRGQPQVLFTNGSCLENTVCLEYKLNFTSLAEKGDNLQMMPDKSPVIGHFICSLRLPR